MYLSYQTFSTELTCEPLKLIHINDISLCLHSSGSRLMLL